MLVLQVRERVTHSEVDESGEYRELGSSLQLLLIVEDAIEEDRLTLVGRFSSAWSPKCVVDSDKALLHYRVLNDFQLVECIYFLDSQCDVTHNSVDLDVNGFVILVLKKEDAQ